MMTTPVQRKWLKLGAIVSCFSMLSFIQLQAIELPPAVVKLEKLQEAKFSQQNKYIGRVEAIEKVLLQPRVEGEITKVNFKEGEFVKKGELLIQFEDIKYKAQVDGAKAQVKMAQAKIIQCESTVMYAQKDLRRQEGLQAKKVVSMQLLEDAQLKSRIAAAGLREALANLSQAKATLLEKENLFSYTKIYAPISGMIGQVNATYGNIVNTQSPSLAEIVQLDPIRISFSISETDFLSMFGSDQNFENNAKISVLLADGNRYKFEAKPDFIDNKIDEDTNTIKIWAKVKNSDLILKPGGFVTLLVSNKKSKKYLKFPLNALRTDNHGNFIYIVNNQGVPKKEHITISGASEGYIFVEVGKLKAGDMVITEGMHKIYPQTKRVFTKEQLFKAMQAKQKAMQAKQKTNAKSKKPVMKKNKSK